MDVHPPLRLANDSRIAIVGGGPAGSFFALEALAIAAQLGWHLNVTIFERKDLTAAGPRGCNMCAGILSGRTIEGLAALGITLPPAIIRAQIRTYQLHWGGYAIAIHPPDPSRQVFSVYRAGGPRRSPYAPTAGFDDYLLTVAKSRGARVVNERVQQVVFAGLPRVSTSRHEEIFDLVVLAVGVNATPPVLESLDFVHPPTEAMAQDELAIDPAPGFAIDSTVHIYFEQPDGLIFGALIPKGGFANVSLLGRHFVRDSIDQFLAVPKVAAIVGSHPPRLCGCRPRVAVAPARGFYSDRFVAVGDVCVTRLYKDGIGSALVTARAAAETVLRHGISRDAFAAHYAPVCRAIARDNRYGRVVFGLVERSKRNALLMRASGRALRAEAYQAPNARVLSKTLWALFTGDANYKEIFWMVFKPKSIARVARAMLAELVE